MIKFNSTVQWSLNLIIAGIIAAAGWGWHVEQKLTRLEDSEKVVISILKDKFKIQDFTENDKNFEPNR